MPKPKLSSKNLFTLVDRQIESRLKFNTNIPYSDQTTRLIETSALNRSEVSTAELISSVQSLLSEALPPVILSGLIVTATSPIGNTVLVSTGKGAVAGVLYELNEEVELIVPFDTTTSIFYINLYKNKVLLERDTSNTKLTIAKVVVPRPGITSLVQDTKDESWNGYIVNFREYKLYGNASGKLEEDSLEFLRDNIGEVLADNIIGNIRLNENLKILNTHGTIELNSDSLLLKDTEDSLLAKFNQNGTFFYDESGKEVAKFGRDEARIGNIVITKNSLQSDNYTPLSAGFIIKDDGNVEFNNLTVRGTVYATGGEIGGWTISSDKIYADETGSLQTGQYVGTGQSGVLLDKDGLRVYNTLLGLTVNLPSDGSAPTFSSGIIESTVFEINTNSVLRTSETVGDGSALSYGILMNNSGIYGCGTNQSVADANFKILSSTGNVYLKGEIVATSGVIGGTTITSTGLYGGLIEGATLRSPIIETSADVPKILIDEEGISYQVSSSIGKYGQFVYGDGTLYGAGVFAYLFNDDYPCLTIMAENINKADIRLYNRTSDPVLSGNTYEEGDIVCVNGDLKMYSSDISDFVRLFRENGPLIIENRTSDPANPESGRIWLRTDL